MRIKNQEWEAKEIIEFGFRSILNALQMTLILPCGQRGWGVIERFLVKD